MTLHGAFGALLAREAARTATAVGFVERDGCVTPVRFAISPDGDGFARLDEISPAVPREPADHGAWGVVI
jgi:hypothetical protein